MLKSEVK